MRKAWKELGLTDFFLLSVKFETLDYVLPEIYDRLQISYKRFMRVITKSFIADEAKLEKTSAKPSAKASASAKKGKFVFCQIKIQTCPFYDCNFKYVGCSACIFFASLKLKAVVEVLIGHKAPKVIIMRNIFIEP